MANTYSQIHIHAVFAVSSRKNKIHPEWQEELYRYITGIVQKNHHKVLVINGMPDHVHLFFGMKPTQSLSELMQDVKGSSSFWINQKGFVPGRFSWQEGYGAFSHSMSAVGNVIDYIKNQQTHHQSKSFIVEYKSLLRKSMIDYNENFIFKSPV